MYPFNTTIGMLFKLEEKKHFKSRKTCDLERNQSIGKSTFQKGFTEINQNLGQLLVKSLGEKVFSLGT